MRRVRPLGSFRDCQLLMPPVMALAVNSTALPVAAGRWRFFAHPGASSPLLRIWSPEK